MTRTAIEQQKLFDNQQIERETHLENRRLKDPEKKTLQIEHLGDQRGWVELTPEAAFEEWIESTPQRHLITTG